MRTADGHIIRKCLDGNSAAFGFLVDKYKESVYALAYSMLHNFHDAEDVTQEVFIKAYRKLHTLKQYDRFHAWLFAITSNFCRNLIRNRSKRPDREFIEDQEPEILEESSLDLYREELVYQSIHEALDSLPDTYCQALTLYYLGGMKTREIAEFLGTTPTAIRHRLVRARARLKEEMLAMISRTFEGKRLPGGFTFQILEAVKHIRVQPMPRATALPWGLSLTASFIIALFSLSSSPDLLKPPNVPIAPLIQGDTRVVRAGEIPVEMLNIAEIRTPPERQMGGSGEEPDDSGVQNRSALSLAPKAKEENVFVRSLPEEILGLRTPFDVEIDSSGNLLVADSANHRIQKFDPEGNLSKTWGVYGRGDGQFDWPMSIAIDSSGDIYVADESNNRVQKFDSEGNFLIKWGSEGSGDGQFVRPEGIAVDGSGNVYVSEVRNHRVQKFDSEGKFLLKWGTEGTRDGQFKLPKNVVVDGPGNVYVTDSGNYRVQKFDSNGNLLIKWGTQGKGNGQFENPYGIAVDDTGNVIVSDVQCRVQKFTPDGKFLSKWGFFGYGDEQLFWPYGIAVDKAGNVYLADGLRSRVQKFDQNGKFLKNIGGADVGGQLNNPCGLALDSAGNVYVVDQANLCIQKFDPEGNFLTKWGKGGSGNGQFAWPYGIAVDKEDNVYVADPNINQRIHKFDSDGKLLDSWGGPGQGAGKFMGCVGVAVNSDGDVYVAERSSNRVQVFDSDGRFQMTWGTGGDGDGQLSWPEGIAIDASDNVYVADTGNRRVQVFDFRGKFLTRWGSQGTEDGQFYSPNGIAVDNSGRVYVVDSGNNRIQVFDSNGNFLTKWGKYGAGDIEFAWPSYGIAVCQSGDVYVSDTFNNRVKVFRSPVGGAVDPANKQPVSWGQLKQTELYQNFPNPFNPETWIPYQLAQDKNVTISIYSVSGQIVRTLEVGPKLAGSYISKENAAHWDGRNDSGEQVASGVYFYSIQAGDFAATKKMVVKQ